MAFTLPALPYAPAALEPHIDAQTMQIHHDKHHQAYVDNLNKAVAGTPNENKSIDEIVAIAGTLPPAVRNNGGGHWNHSFFWQIIAPNAGGKPSGKVAESIDADFGSFDAFKEKFTLAKPTEGSESSSWDCSREIRIEKVGGATVRSSSPITAAKAAISEAVTANDFAPENVRPTESGLSINEFRGEGLKPCNVGRTS